MKITARQVDAFLRKPPETVCAVLVYGPDKGLAAERMDMLARTVVQDLKDPFDVSIMNGEEIAANSSRLSDEACALSMTGGRRLVRVQEGTDGMASAVKDYLRAPNMRTLVLVEAGPLTARSALRKLFEKDNALAALPCYVEEEKDLAQFVRSFLKENGKSADADAVRWLSVNLQGDRRRARSEMEKLVLYMGETPMIQLADVEACCGMPGLASLDALVYATASGRTESALSALRKILEEGVPFMAVIRALGNHFRRLHLVKACVLRGESMDAAVKRLSPPLFFKVERAFKDQVALWPLPVIETVLARLSALESQCKKTGAPVETLCAQAVLSISRAPRGATAQARNRQAG